MTHNRTCPICAKTVAPERLARYPSAVVCGRRACSLKYRRAAFNKIRRRYRNKRIATDPAFQQRENQRARRRYDLRRLAAGKTVVRKPLANEHSAFGAFMSSLLRNASGALGRAARAFGAFCG